MWLHIIIFAALAVAGVRWNIQRKEEGEKNKEGKKLFLMVAFCGNLLGAVLTFQNGKDQIYSDGHRLKKEETGAYEERFFVSVDGEKAGDLYVQIPEKEVEQTEEPEEEKISPEEERLQEIQEAVARYNQEKEDADYYYLPEEWEGKHFTWEQQGDKSGTLMAALFLIAGVALMILKSREELTLVQKKREQMLLDYPGLIMKFTLLVQAGMTARKAFQKIAGDYRKRKSRKERYAYEEILVVCYEMDSGVSEAEAYRRFGERCGQVKYKTFATLLIQNLQKGSRHLEDMLERESVEAWEERKRKARVLGEAAATKLLGPMVLMLLVVMAVIMIPACLTFYGGA